MSEIYRTEAFYFDSEHRLTDKEHAESVVLKDYDENGHIIKTTWGRWIDVPNIEEWDTPEED